MQLAMLSVVELLSAVLTLTLSYHCFGTASAFSTSSISRSRNRHPLAGATAAAAIIDTTTNQDKNNELIQPIIQQNVGDPSAFELLAQKVVYTLLKSDSDTDENEHAYGSASQGLWINSKAAKEMQNILDRVALQVSIHMKSSLI